MFSKRTLASCLEQLGQQLLDSEDVKAFMMSKDDNGDISITLVEGREDSHKVKFGRVDHKSRSLVRNDRNGHRGANGRAHERAGRSEGNANLPS